MPVVLPNGVAVDKTGNVFVADKGVPAIRLISPSLGTLVEL